MTNKIIRIEIKNGIAEVDLKSIPKGFNIQIDDYDSKESIKYTSTLWANDGLVNVSRIED